MLHTHVHVCLVSILLKVEVLNFYNMWKKRFRFGRSAFLSSWHITISFSKKTIAILGWKNFQGVDASSAYTVESYFSLVQNKMNLFNTAILVLPEGRLVKVVYSVLTPIVLIPNYLKITLFVRVLWHINITDTDYALKTCLFIMD